MLGESDIIGFVGTADAARARRFYSEVLGLRFIEESPFAVVVEANGTLIRLTPVPNHVPVGHTVLGWRVTDITATVRGLAGKGVAFERFPGLTQDALGIWTAPDGHRIAWFKDPDGNLLSLTQFAASR